MAKILNVALGLSEKITVYGNDYPTKDGTGERDYIHIKDVIDAHFKALRHIDVIERHEKFNLGTGISVSVIDLIETFNAVNKCNVRYEISGREKVMLQCVSLIHLKQIKSLIGLQGII